MSSLINPALLQWLECENNRLIADECKRMETAMVAQNRMPSLMQGLLQSIGSMIVQDSSCS